ncbi:hypothetical protein KHP62_10600 [Rhodobacteraceae bacterium NNCM2]|nr:hypothetical protein [Coraliihabitans acroporae]
MLRRPLLLAALMAALATASCGKRGDPIRPSDMPAKSEPQQQAEPDTETEQPVTE